MPFGELSFKIMFLTRSKQTMTLQRQLNRPCAFFSDLFKNHIERFDVAAADRTLDTERLRNGTFHTWSFLEMAILYF